jgi:hypothetical protein
VVKQRRIEKKPEVPQEQRTPQRGVGEEELLPIPLSRGENKKSEETETLRGLPHVRAFHTCQELPLQEGG